MDQTKRTAPPVDPKDRLARLEERYRHELMPEDERCELLDLILRLRRKLRVSY